MLHRGIGNEQRKHSTLHQSRHQKGVFRSKGHGIKNAFRYIDRRAPNRKSCGIQVSNAAISLKQVGLKHSQPQFLCPTNHADAVSHEMKLKILMLTKLRDRSRKSQQTICLKSAISVRKKQDLTFRNLDASVSRGRNSGMRLPMDCERVASGPPADKGSGQLGYFHHLR